MRLLLFLLRLFFVVVFLGTIQQFTKTFIARFRDRFRHQPQKQWWEHNLYPPVDPKLAEDGEYEIVE